jgi:hypothetical protein
MNFAEWRKISSNSTWWYKKAFPAIWFSCLAVGTCVWILGVVLEQMPAFNLFIFAMWSCQKIKEQREVTMLRLLVAAALVPLGGVQLSAREEETKCGADHNLYKLVVTEVQLAKSPPWNAKAASPPLSARQALKLASATKSEMVKDSAEWQWRLQELSLTHLPTRSVRDRWYWVAHYTASPRQGGLGGGAPCLYIAVLMNGTVIKPQPVGEEQ